MAASNIWRLVAAFALLAGSPSITGGEPVATDADVCAGVTGSYASLATRIDKARRALAVLERDKAADETKAAKRTEIADLVFRQDCLRPDAQPDPSRGPAAAPSWVTVTTYYATNRALGPVSGSIASYTGDRASGDIAFGRVTVSIPTNRQPGELNLPLNLWLFELPTDPSKHFMIKSVTPLQTTNALNEMRTRVGQLSRQSVLIFVHGYNVPFRDAALRTAQLAHDLNFPGLPMFFSWPSAGTTAGYPHDEEMSELSLGAFNALLDRVATLNASEVYIVAHSMGNRVVTRAIAQRLASGKPMPSNLKGLMLAAPDINADIFREQISPSFAALSSTRKTIYASNSDAALRASSYVHDFPRVGLTRPKVQVYGGWETVDATAAAPVRRAWGHSYVVDSPRVIRDMQMLIFQNRGAAQRSLAKAGVAPNTYWRLN